MESVPGRPERNYAVAEERIRHVAGEGATFVTLPECSINGYDIDWFRSGASGAHPYPGDDFEGLASLSDVLGVTIALSDLETAGNRLYDSALIFEAGRLVSLHRKTIPTEREIGAGLFPGDKPADPLLMGGAAMVVAPMVCYEYAFPEIARDLSARGAQLLSVSAAIRTGFEHLIPVRIRARAQDNSCFVLMANAVGNDFCGNSLIVEPGGSVLAAASAGAEEAIFADVDTDVIGRISRDASPSDEEHARVAKVLRSRRD